MSGRTLATKSYSSGRLLFQNVRGLSAVNSIRTIDLMLLKPYFQGVTRRNAAPCCFGNPRWNGVRSIAVRSLVVRDFEGLGELFTNETNGSVGVGAHFEPVALSLQHGDLCADGVGRQ